jgi:hypothetical protein
MYGNLGYTAHLRIESPLDVSRIPSGTLAQWKQSLVKVGLDVRKVKFDSSLSHSEAKNRTYGSQNEKAEQVYHFWELIGENDYWEGDGNLVDQIKRQGFDGVKSQREDESHDIWIAFEPKQIKVIVTKKLDARDGSTVDTARRAKFRRGEPAAKGYLYLDALYIEEVLPHWPEAAKAEGKWHLIIGRNERITDDLEALERNLYDWALSEGYFDDKGVQASTPMP